MVWRKKKQQVAESDWEHSGVVPEGVIPRVERGGDASSAKAAGLGAVSDSKGGLIPQNQDPLNGVWPADIQEFCLPVTHSASQRPYVIPRNYRISGNLSTARQVIVHGEFAAGVLEAPTVTVAPSGGVRGRVTAKNVQISGTVDASVHARASIEVSGRGRLAGDIRTPAVKVWPGAILHASKLTVGC
jgi:cytoskeletal protein CcmA (bactofilin family)